MLSENTETRRALLPHLLDGEMQDLIGQMTCSKLRSSSWRRQNWNPNFLVSRPPLWFGSATQKAVKAVWFQVVFPLGWEKWDTILKEKATQGTVGKKKKRREKNPNSFGSNKNIVKHIFRFCILSSSLYMYWWVCILPMWLCVNIDLSVACAMWFGTDRCGPYTHLYLMLKPQKETSNIGVLVKRKIFSKLRKLLDHPVQYATEWSMGSDLLL